MWEKVRVGRYERIAMKHVITICKIDDQCRFNAWSRAAKAGGSGTTQREGVGRVVEAGLRMAGHMYTHGWFMSMYSKKPPQYGKVISLQLK